MRTTTLATLTFIAIIVMSMTSILSADQNDEVGLFSGEGGGYRWVLEQWDTRMLGQPNPDGNSMMVMTIDRESKEAKESTMFIVSVLYISPASGQLREVVLAAAALPMAARIMLVKQMPDKVKVTKVTIVAGAMKTAPVTFPE